VKLGRAARADACRLALASHEFRTAAASTQLSANSLGKIRELLNPSMVVLLRLDWLKSIRRADSAAAEKSALIVDALLPR
jgi:hypothetical protein